MPEIISPLYPIKGNMATGVQAVKGDETVSFGGYLEKALQYTDGLQKEADRAVQELAAGNLDNLHDLMITVEQAQLSLQLTVQVVNKVIQAYQEVYRMQI
ncbi:MAG: flagellar hook-basal body complex protein FliE [Firmicutes bacterium]|nr:flagellar hook-basal body complex protein FliE [Bacillota bacterium]